MPIQTHARANRIRLMTFRVHPCFCVCGITLMAVLPLSHPAKAASFQFRHPESGRIELQVDQMTRTDVLDRLAMRLGFIWHASGLPQTKITVSCQGESLEPILDCLLGQGISYLIRRQPDKQARMEQLWLITAAENNPVSQPEKTVPHPRQRANRLARLVAKEGADARIESALQAGLQDDSPLVRAQAVYGLSRRDPQQALIIGLADQDAGVRLMAVENAGEGVTEQTLLQGALTDVDETVSALAALKLEAIQHQAEIPNPLATP